MIRMFRLARLAPVVVVAVLCLFVALRYAIAQTTPAAPTIDSVTPGDTSLTVAWTAPAGETGIIAYDVRHIETSADETDDANWTEMDNAWTSGALQYTITMLTNGTQYDVQVRAVNSNGDGTVVRNNGRDTGIACPHHQFRARRRPRSVCLMDRSHWNHLEDRGLRRAVHRHQL